MKKGLLVFLVALMFSFMLFAGGAGEEDSTVVKIGVF